MVLLKNASSFIVKITEKLIAFTLMLMLVLLIIQVFYRYVLSSPLSWTEELMRYLMTWLVFLGASVASQKGGHLGITFIQEKLNNNVKKIVEIIIQILAVMFLALIIYYGIELIQTVINTKSPVLRVSMAIPYSSVVVGATLMFIHSLVNVIYSIFNFRKIESLEE